MEVDDWLSSVARDLGLDPSVSDHALMALVLDLTRSVAHGVARPAAPLTAFLVGLAAGRAGGDAPAVRLALARVQALLEGTPPGR
ncbi:MAG: DUF6457 domain-containing protein [Frankiaceae bacterium]